MKLSHYAKKLGIHYRTAWRHFVKGLIPGAYRLPTGTIIVPESAILEGKSKTEEECNEKCREK